VTLSITTFEAAMWTVATTPWGTGEHPHFYKWLGTGGTVSRTANKKLAKLCWPSRTRSPKRLIVFLEPKSGGARPPPKKKIFFRRFAPDRCPNFRSGPVPPLSN